MSSKFPTARGFVIQNILRCFEDEGGDGHAACLAVGLPLPASLNAGDFVPAKLYFDLLNHITAQTGDLCFAARVGRTSARQGVTALVEARRASRTIGEFLIRCQIVFKAEQDSGWYILECDGARATLKIGRWPNLKADISKIETLNAAGWITIFRDEVGEVNLEGLTAALPEPQAMPDDILPRRQCFRSKDGRMKLSFPAAWLVTELKCEWAVESVVLRDENKGSVRKLGTEPIRQLVSNLISRGNVDLGTVAYSLGMSKRKLQRMLSSHGTTFRRLLHDQRLSYSSHLLSTSRQTMQEIAGACGFSSSQALSKSFRAAFGLSPSEYRQKLNATDHGSDAQPE